MKKTMIKQGGGGHNRLNNHFAFTLAEVLITLAIIGVVAAISIPTVITNYQKNQYVTQLKKFYTGTTNGLRAYMASQGVTQLSDTDLTAQIKNSLGSAGLNALLTASEPTFKQEFNKIFKVSNVYNGTNVQAMYPGLKCKYLSSTEGCGNYGGAIVLADGSIINVTFYTRGEMYKAMICGSSHNRVCNTLSEFHQAEKELNLPITSYYRRAAELQVDVNGFKGPNTYGKDIFFFEVGDDGMLYPRGGLDFAIMGRPSGYTEFYWSDGDTGMNCSTTNSYGNGCAARIMEEGWKMNY